MEFSATSVTLFYYYYKHDDNFIVNFIISDSLNLAYSSIGYNCLYGNSHTKFFTDYDSQTANTIRFYRHMYGTHSPFEHYISNISS